MRLARLTLALLALVLLAPATAAADRTVSVTDFAFSPAPLAIQPGESVTWSFQGPTEHSATSRPGQAQRWDSDLKGAGATFTRRFTKPGRFQYICTPHPYMTGTVQVGEDQIAKSARKPRTRRSGRRVRTAFRLLEPAKMVARLRGPTKRRVVKRRLAPGRRSAAWGRLRPGSYRATIVLVDDFDKRTTLRAAFVLR